MLRKSVKIAMQKVNNLKVVIDTNLLLSAIIIPQSTPDKIIQAWKKDSFILLVPQPLMDELEDVTSRKKFLDHYILFKERSEELIASLKAGAELVDPLLVKKLPIYSRDLEDDYLLATALGADANYLITGDDDLLVLDGDPKLGNLKILSATEFLDLIK